MRLTSPAFEDGGIIPSPYTCEGKNVNPQLNISDVPKEAKSLVLIVDDPDVPKTIIREGIYDHWIIFNLLPNIKSIHENTVPQGLQGKNTAGSLQYIGPCPPDKEHRYFFKLYALGKMLDLRAGSTKQEVEAACKGHILAQCTLMGRYEKGKGY